MSFLILLFILHRVIIHLISVVSLCTALRERFIFMAEYTFKKSTLSPSGVENYLPPLYFQKMEKHLLTTFT